MDNKELKPCPFCGSDKRIVRSEPRHEGALHIVGCASCRNKTGQHDTLKDALTAWNRRAHDAEALREKEEAVRAEAWKARIEFAAELAGRLSVTIHERKEHIALPRKPPFSDREEEMAKEFLAAIEGLRNACYAAAHPVAEPAKPKDDKHGESCPNHANCSYHHIICPRLPKCAPKEPQ